MIEENNPLWRTLSDGGPETYKKLASIYDQVVAAVNYKSPECVVHEWSRCYADVTTRQKVFDAGCGTGLAGVEIRKLPCAPLIDLYGGDLCPEMMEFARFKGVYDRLQVMNLKQELPFEDEFFDSVTCSGIFLQSHCGPECLPNIARVLKVGGYIVASVRMLFWEEMKSDWEQISRQCNLDLVKSSPIPHLRLDSGETNVLVLQKMGH